MKDIPAPSDRPHGNNKGFKRGAEIDAFLAEVLTSPELDHMANTERSRETVYRDWLAERLGTAVSALLLRHGSAVTHDALRLLARHGCCLCATGEGGVRLYTAPPHVPDSSRLACQQVNLSASKMTRLEVARRMYALRSGEIVSTRDMEVLRGMEGSRIKRAYLLAAERAGQKAYARSTKRGPQFCQAQHFRSLKIYNNDRVRYERFPRMCVDKPFAGCTRTTWQ